MIIGVLVAIAVAVFVDIQLYMHRPNKRQDLDDWFTKFEKHNRERYRDPEVAWRYSILDQAFHRYKKR